MTGPAVQFAKRLEYVVDGDRRFQSRRRPERRARGDRGRIGCPGGENGPLLGHGQRGVGYAIPGMIEYRTGMKQRVDVEYVVVERCRPPRSPPAHSRPD